MHEKVNRVMKVTSDFYNPKHKFSILDIACGSGLYSTTAAHRFPHVEVTAMDARWDRMQKGVEIAEKDGLDISFMKDDVINVSLNSYGEFDIIYFLGILYHLDFPDSLNVLKNLRKMLNTLIIDTHISLTSKDAVYFTDGVFYGEFYQEHPPNATSEQKQKNLKASIDNERSFWYDKKSLFKALSYAGYSTVYECHVPFEPNKPKDRITLVARC